MNYLDGAYIIIRVLLIIRNQEKKKRIRAEGNVLMEAEGGKAFGCRALSQGMRTAARVWKGKEMDSSVEPQKEPACPNTLIFIPLKFILGVWSPSL